MAYLIDARVSLIAGIQYLCYILCSSWVGRMEREIRYIGMHIQCVHTYIHTYIRRYLPTGLLRSPQIIEPQGGERRAVHVIFFQKNFEPLLANRVVCFSSRH